MSERGIQLQQAADGQISELIALLSARGEAALSLTCPGREKMGDGTVAACASHTAERYLLIAGFLEGSREMPGVHSEAGHGAHRIPRFLRARGPAPGGHAEGHQGEGMHDGDYTAENVDFEGLLERLSAGRDGLGLLADMTDEQLDTVPPDGSFRFCDGQRTLEQVVSSLLKHQGRQIDALRAALS